MAIEKSLPPQSSTVSAVFEQFIKKLAEEKTLPKSAIDALAKCLLEQKLDHEALREAISTTDEPAQ